MIKSILDPLAMLSLSLMHCNKANSLEATWVMLNSNHVLPLVCFAI